MKNTWRILAAVAGTFVVTSLGWWLLDKETRTASAENAPKAVPMAMPIQETPVLPPAEPTPATAPTAEVAKPVAPKAAPIPAPAKAIPVATTVAETAKPAIPRPMSKTAALKTDATGDLISLEARPERYTTNPNLEKLVGKGSQASDMTISVQSPGNGSRLRLHDGYADLLFKGTIESAVSPDGLCYYKIYPNNERDFTLDRAIYRESIRFVGNGNKHAFEWNAKIALPRGLYYVVMEKKISNEILHVSKIIIE